MSTVITISMLYIGKEINRTMSFNLIISRKLQANQHRTTQMNKKWCLVNLHEGLMCFLLIHDLHSFELNTYHWRNHSGLDLHSRWLYNSDVRSTLPVFHSQSVRISFAFNWIYSKESMISSTSETWTIRMSAEFSIEHVVLWIIYKAALHTTQTHTHIADEWSCSTTYAWAIVSLVFFNMVHAPNHRKCRSTVVLFIFISMCYSVCMDIYQENTVYIGFDFAANLLLWFTSNE